MKLLKIVCFFAAGVIVEAAMYFIILLSMIFNLWFCIIGALLVTAGGIALGFAARDMALNTLKTKPFPLVLSYIAGTIAAVIAMFMIVDITHPLQPTSTGLGNLANLGRTIAFSICFLTVPSAAVNAVVQVIIVIRDKIKQNKE